MRAECVQGEGGGQKRPKNCVRTLCMAPVSYKFLLFRQKILHFRKKNGKWLKFWLSYTKSYLLESRRGPSGSLRVVSSVNRVSSDLATLAASSLSKSPRRRLSLSEAKTASIDQASEAVSTSRELAEATDPEAGIEGRSWFPPPPDFCQWSVRVTYNIIFCSQLALSQFDDRVLVSLDYMLSSETTDILKCPFQEVAGTKLAG